MSDDTRITPTDSEKYVLGCMIQSPDAMAEALDAGVAPNVFYIPAHAAVCETLIELDSEGQALEPTAIADRLQPKLGKNAAAPHMLILDLVSAAPVTANVTYHTTRVLDGYHRRQVAAMGAHLRQYAADPATDVAELVESARGTLETVSDSSVREYRPEKLANLIDEAQAYFQEDTRRSVGSGLPSLDQITGGFKPGQMIIAAARPGVGKSTFALGVARHVAKTGAPVVYFTMEMGKPEMVARTLAAECSLDLGRLTHGALDDDEARRLASIPERSANMPLFFDDAPGLTMGELRAKCRRVAREQGCLGMVVVDYLGLLTATRRFESRQLEVAEYSRALKMLAKELECPVLVVVQLSRMAEMSDRPRLHHLRESGALEQDADKVILLHKTDGGDVEMNVEKNRAGELGGIVAYENLRYARFLDPESRGPFGGGGSW